MFMDKGMTGIKALLLILTCFCLNASGQAWGQTQIYKIVDENGNVTFTDQSPGDGTEPMVLPELSVVSTDPVEEAEAATVETPEAEAEAELTPRDLRKMYRDFRITQPAPEETFWGTANTVVIGWGVKEPLQEGMKVQIVVNGEAQPASLENMLAMTLDRGEHTASAVLLDARGRRVITAPSVRFFVHQQSIQRSRP
jgi:Domain of unknown function (DUF4124)